VSGSTSETGTTAESLWRFGGRFAFWQGCPRAMNSRLRIKERDKGNPTLLRTKASFASEHGAGRINFFGRGKRSDVSILR